jgi:hypothetical protein
MNSQQEPSDLVSVYTLRSTEQVVGELNLDYELDLKIIFEREKFNGYSLAHMTENVIGTIFKTAHLRIIYENFVQRLKRKYHFPVLSYSVDETTETVVTPAQQPPQVPDVPQWPILFYFPARSMPPLLVSRLENEEPLDDGEEDLLIKNLVDYMRQYGK